jgi:hypothetical protein
MAAKTTVVSGSGYAPGYGKVTNPTKRKPLLGGSGPNSIRDGAARALTKYTPQIPGSGAGAPAAGTGPAPQVENITALPPDATYEQQIGALGRSRDDTLAQLAGQRTSTLADYGYNASFDGSGGVTGLTVDPNNPYSKAALLQKSYENAKRGTTTGLAAQGHLYSSSMTNEQNNNDTGYSTSKDNLEKNLGSILASILGQERATRTAYETDAAGAYGDRVGRASSNPTYSPTGTGAPAASAAPATYSSMIDSPPAGSSTADKLKVLAQYGAVNEYKNAQGHQVRTFKDGHKEVLVDGRWKRV